MKKRNNTIIYLNILSIVTFCVICINLFLYVNKGLNKVYKEKYLRVENSILYYPSFNDEKDNYIAEYLNIIDPSKVDTLKYKVNYIGNFINILFVSYYNNVITDYYSLIFDKKNKVASINDMVTNEELLHDKVYLYLVTNKLDFNYEIYEYAKKSYLFKDNELEIFISNYDDKDSVTIIALNYWELKEHLNFPYKLDENYVVMTPINDREEIPTTKPPENKNKKLIAFTFDDGPSKYTLELLNILDEFNAKASFFLVGYNIRIRNEIVVEMFNRGFEIGNHTIDHSRLTAFNCEKANNKINQNNELFVNLTGNEMRLLRPPYGSINKKLRECIDHPVILWSVDSRDWETRNRDAVVHEVLSHVKEGDIVLFHDLYSTTIDAIKILLPILYADGFKVVSVSELFAAKNLPLEDHQIYRKAS